MSLEHEARNVGPQGGPRRAGGGGRDGQDHSPGEAEYRAVNRASRSGPVWSTWGRRTSTTPAARRALSSSSSLGSPQAAPTLPLQARLWPGHSAPGLATLSRAGLQPAWATLPVLPLLAWARPQRPASLPSIRCGPAALPPCLPAHFRGTSHSAQALSVHLKWVSHTRRKRRRRRRGRRRRN